MSMNEDFNAFRMLIEPEINPYEEEQERARQNLPHVDFEGLRKIDAESNSSARTDSIDFDLFLKEKFDGIGIFEFMKIYSKLHIGAEFCLPVPPEITCVFKNESSPTELSKFISNHQQTIGTNPENGRTFLNLHNDSVYEFTLIRADFDIEENSEFFWQGYHYKTDRFMFFIKSSIQFDLTVVYNVL